jgi:NAD+ kinase
MNTKKIAILSSDVEDARQAARRLKKKYGAAPPEEADIIVTLGGDGLMLQTLHRFMDKQVPIYGMNLGSIGFLMNEYNEENLLQRLEKAELTEIHPLHMEVIDTDGEKHHALAINEVSLLRQTHQTAKLKISIDGKERMAELICDGVLVATPAGSTAYNLSAQGPILPINTPLLALTPISPFRPRRWRGAILPHEASVNIEVLEAAKRPVSATADTKETRNAASVTIGEDKSHSALMMFDEGHNLDERILREQFLY